MHLTFHVVKGNLVVLIYFEDIINFLKRVLSGNMIQASVRLNRCLLDGKPSLFREERPFIPASLFIYAVMNAVKCYELFSYHV